MGFVRGWWIAARNVAIAAETDSTRKHELQRTKPPFELLSDLWELYWTSISPLKLDNEIEIFWEKLRALPGSLQSAGTVSWDDISGPPGTQIDAKDFLEWMVRCEEELAL